MPQACSSDAQVHLPKSQSALHTSLVFHCIARVTPSVMSVTPLKVLQLTHPTTHNASPPRARVDLSTRPPCHYTTQHHQYTSTMSTAELRGTSFNAANRDPFKLALKPLQGQHQVRTPRARVNMSTKRAHAMLAPALCVQDCNIHPSSTANWLGASVMPSCRACTRDRLLTSRRQLQHSVLKRPLLVAHHLRHST